MKLWIVGKSIRDCDDGQVWEFQGVYDSEPAAAANCRDSRYFYAPAALNQSLPDDRCPWPDSIRPTLESAIRGQRKDGKPNNRQNTGNAAWKELADKRSTLKKIKPDKIRLTRDDVFRLGGQLIYPASPED